MQEWDEIKILARVLIIPYIYTNSRARVSFVNLLKVKVIQGGSKLGTKSKPAKFLS